MITITAFKSLPPFAQGIVRDLRVRWALGEAGLGYQEKLVGPAELASDEYRKIQPFGQVPAYQDGDLALFESGAIVLHIAEASEVLLPTDPLGRAVALQWLFAALNTIEPAIERLAEIDLLYADEEWGKLRRPAAVNALNVRLDDLVSCLDGRDYLGTRFSVADLMMTCELRILRHTNLVTSRPVLHAYQQRCESRPAFRVALADHLRPLSQDGVPLPH